MPISNSPRGPRTAVGPAAALLLAMNGALAVAAPLVVATIALPDPVRWDDVSVDPAAHRLYVTHRERADVIDIRVNTVLLQLAPTPGVHGAAASYDLGRVFTSNGADGTVGVFDATSGKLNTSSRDLLPAICRIAGQRRPPRLVPRRGRGQPATVVLLPTAPVHLRVSLAA